MTINASHNVIPTDACNNSVKAINGNSCVILTTTTSALMRFNHQIWLRNRRIAW